MKYFVILFSFLFSTVFSYENGWVSLNGDTIPSEPEYIIENNTTQSVKLSYYISGFNMTEVDSPYWRLELPNHPVMDSLGLPELPFLQFRLAIPECDSVNVIVTLGSPTVFDDIDVAPVPETYYENMNYIEDFDPDTRINIELTFSGAYVCIDNRDASECVKILFA